MCPIQATRSMPCMPYSMGVAGWRCDASCSSCWGGPPSRTPPRHVCCRRRFCQERGEALPPLPPPAGALPALAQGASEDARGGVPAGDLPTLEELRAVVTAHALQDLPAEVGFLDTLGVDGSLSYSYLYLYLLLPLSPPGISTCASLARLAVALAAATNSHSK